MCSVGFNGFPGLLAIFYLLFFHACWSLIVFRKDEPDPKDNIMLFIISFIIKP